jgi:hypothetical protein
MEYNKRVIDVTNENLIKQFKEQYPSEWEIAQDYVENLTEREAAAFFVAVSKRYLSNA